MKKILTYLIMFAIAILIYMCTVYQATPSIHSSYNDWLLSGEYIK